MTDLPTIAEGWQDDEQTYQKLRAVREATPGLPCESCEGRTACGISGHECAEFKHWCKTGKR